MMSSFRWIGLLTFLSALVWGSGLSAIQDKGNTNNRRTQNTNPTNKAPYTVEDQIGYCPDGKVCVSPQSLPSPQRTPDPRGGSQPVLASDKIVSKPVPEPTPANITQKTPIEPKSNLPWEKHTPPTGGDADHGPPPEPNPKDDHWLRGPLPFTFTTASSPILAIALVGAGVLTGLVGSVVILKHRFANPLATRPNGDTARSHLLGKSKHTQPWQDTNRDSKVFQLQYALRRKLISREEFRELRSKYLIAGNFSFSMLIPISLALTLVTMGLNKWYGRAAISIVAALTTILLSTYALDRRHQFRSAYRTLIIENLTLKQDPPSHPTPPPDAALWWGVFTQLVSILLIGMTTWSGAKGTSTEGSGERGEE